MKACILLPVLFLVAALQGLRAQDETVYPYTVHYLDIATEGKTVTMAYMDVPAAAPNGRSVVLLHGKNFNGYYWKDAIGFLHEAGYRVIVPDQVGWGKSEKAELHYSFHTMSHHTKTLLDSLQIDKAILVGHSMGGMLAVRFALMYPETVDTMILENPIGLEDYRLFVPYRSIDELNETEMASNYESIRTLHQSYYPEWSLSYEDYVKVQATALASPEFRQIARINALTYLMIYEQPVLYELKNVKAKTLFIIGQEDRTILGKANLPDSVAKTYGQYPQLGRSARLQVPDSELVELRGIGHIPHIQSPAEFQKAVMEFLQ